MIETPNSYFKIATVIMYRLPVCIPGEVCLLLSHISALVDDVDEKTVFNSQRPSCIVQKQICTKEQRRRGRRQIGPWREGNEEEDFLFFCLLEDNVRDERMGGETWIDYHQQNTNEDGLAASITTIRTYVCLWFACFFFFFSLSHL
jgi:hypothetical protein